MYKKTNINPRRIIAMVLSVMISMIGLASTIVIKAKKRG